MRSSMLSAPLILALALIPAWSLAEPVRHGALTLSAFWSPASLGKGRPGAAYLVIENEGASADGLIEVTTPAAGMVMFHQSMVTDGVATMTEAGAPEIAPGASLTLEPGGLHLMLMHLAAPLDAGTSYLLTLTFAVAGTVTLEVPVLTPGSAPPKE